MIGLTWFLHPQQGFFIIPACHSVRIKLHTFLPVVNFLHTTLSSLLFFPVSSLFPSSVDFIAIVPESRTASPFLIICQHLHLEPQQSQLLRKFSETQESGVTDIIYKDGNKKKEENRHTEGGESKKRCIQERERERVSMREMLGVESVCVYWPSH